MSTAEARAERLDDLLVQRTVEGLDPAEHAELEHLLAASEGVDPEIYDEAAAWFWVGAEGPEQALPADVAERVLHAVPAPAGQAPAGNVTPLRPRRDRRLGSRTGWLAAAALLVIALAGWWPRLQAPDRADPAAARDELIATAPDLVRVEWSSTEHPRAQQLGGGYVVWSDRMQRGYMTFRGMPDNDPDRHQYQLWVFDATRTDEHPVDGGVFNARSGSGEVVVPIRNKLPVRRAKLFAVTLEPPGGVVVSDRDPLLWLAQPSSQS